MSDRALILPTEDWLDEVAAYRQEMLDAGSDLDGAGPLRRMGDPAAWLAAVRSYMDPDTVPAGLVQATLFLCVLEEEHRLLGMIQVRHRLNEYLAAYAGHIGYSVRPGERRRGVASWMLAQSLPFCRELGLERVMVACEPHNEGSRRTILKNGGIYAKTVHEPEEDIDLEQYWIEL